VVSWRAIFLLNLFMGWTVFGWIGALIWAYTRPPQITYVEGRQLGEAQTHSDKLVGY